MEVEAGMPSFFFFHVVKKFKISFGKKGRGSFSQPVSICVMPVFFFGGVWDPSPSGIRMFLCGICC